MIRTYDAERAQGMRSSFPNLPLDIIEALDESGDNRWGGRGSFLSN